MNKKITQVQTSRISKLVDQLASFTEAGRHYTRLVFSEEFYNARQWLKTVFDRAGLRSHIDDGGNLIGVRESNSTDREVKKVLIGSHIDTVPAGGRFDGIAGVIAALEVVHYLNENAIELPFELEINDYLGEELNVWGTSCLGSRHMAGLITAEMLNRIDADGRRLGAELARVGGKDQASDGPRKDVSRIKACLELHIEQAKTLDNSGHDIGIVTAIPGIYRYGISIAGQAGHSGTTIMPDRRDALVAASYIIQKTSELASQIAQDDNQHFVATVGKIDVFPNGAAIVPGGVEMTLDLRAVSEHSWIKFVQDFEHTCDLVMEKTNCKVSLKSLAAADVAPMNKELMQLLFNSAKDNGLSVSNISSGAGHDTAHLSRVAPAAMIFIPCREGLSHCPEEFASSEAIAKGANVLIGCVMALANKTLRRL